LADAFYLQAFRNPLLKHYTFQHSDQPVSLPLAFSPHLFQDYDYRKLQAEKRYSFYIINEKLNRIEAFIHFTISQGIALSPFSAPFGGIEFSTDIPTKIIYNFLIYVEGVLNQHQVKRICIKLPPSLYDQRKTSLVETFLLNLGFEITSAEVSALLKVDDRSLASLMYQGQRRKLRKAEQQKLQVKMLDNSRAPMLFDFIQQCRDERSYSLSITYAELKKTMAKFSRQFVLFAVYDNEILIAASILIHVNEKVLYNFLPAHLKSYDHLSPMVFLLNNVYQYCQGHNIEWLDLGTSALAGKPNFSLLDFKLRLGGTPSNKLTFEKNIVAMS
jgi:Acetyltransferase (GNAT) domain